MAPLLTQANFDQILATLLTILGQATSPKETYAATDRITRLTTLHKKLYLDPLEAKPKRKQKTDVAAPLAEPPVAACTPARLPVQARSNEDQINLWHDTLPIECLTLPLVSPEDLAAQDPYSRQHVHLTNYGIVRRHHYDQIREAGLIDEDQTSLTPLALYFYNDDKPVQVIALPR